MLGVLERKKAENQLMSYADLLFIGRGKKDSFLTVNWEHPRVQVILQRAIRLFTDVAPDAAPYFQKAADGELADNYMGDRSDDDPLPETLPGIKLLRPEGRLLKKIELLTGKKIPPDPRFPEKPKRPERGHRSHDEMEATEAVEVSGNSSPWKWAALAAASAAVLLAVQQWIKSR